MTEWASRLREAGPGGTRHDGLWLGFLGPFGLEVALRSGLVAWVGLDLQHGDLEESDVAGLARASSVPLLVRVRDHRHETVGRALDAGVHGIIIPGVGSADQARGIVSAAHIPPQGRRSTGLSRAGLGHGAAQPLVLPMVETSDGLAQVENILAVDGVDGVFVGPYDLSVSLGVGGDVLHESVIEAIQHVVQTAHDAGRLAGIFSGNAALTGLLPPVQLLGVDTDAGVLQAGLAHVFGQAGSAHQSPPAPQGRPTQG